MNRFEKSDVPFVPSQIAQPEGGSIVAPPSAPRLTAEGGGNQATTVLAGVSGAFAPDVAMIMASALELPAQPQVCLKRTSADVMAITKWSIVFACPNLADSRGSPSVLAAQPTCPHKNATLEAVITEPS
jgi:hypothetical protein